MIPIYIVVKSFFAGSVRFTVESENFALLNRLRKFKLNDIQVGGGRIAFSCPLSCKHNVQQFLRNEKYTVSENRNVFRALNFFYMRLSLAIAAVIAVVLLVVLDSFVFSISVVGVEGQQRAEIMQFIGQHDLRPLTFKQQERAEDVAEQITASFDFVGHAAAKIVGTRLIFNINRTEVAGDSGANSNIVASADGVVDRVIVVSGRALVKTGDVVRKGDVLIIGEYQNGEETFAPCRAVGEVRLRVQYAESIILSSTVEEKVQSGVSKTVRDVFCVGYGAKRQRNDIGFEYYTAEEKITDFVFFLKFNLIETTYYELVERTRQVDLKTYRHVAARELVEKLKHDSGINVFDHVDSFFTDLTADSIVVEVVGTTIIEIRN